MGAPPFARGFHTVRSTLRVRLLNPPDSGSQTMSASDLILTAIFFAVGVLYSSVGHAGASGYLAVMALMNFPAAQMRPVSLLLNTLVASIATLQFARAGHFKWSLLWPFLVLSIPLAYVGGLIKLPEHIFQPIVGCVLLFSAWRMALAIRPSRQPGPVRPPSIPLAILAGGLLGLLAGLTGTGGGIFLSPLILLLSWGDPKSTAAVSAPFILVNSISGLAALAAKPIDWPSAFPYWAGAVIVGGAIGSTLGSHTFNPRVLRLLLAAVLVIAGGKLITTPLHKHFSWGVSNATAARRDVRPCEIRMTKCRI